MAYGVPVVASRVGGLPEVVEHGINGALTDNDPEAIAEAIRYVLEARSEMCVRARQTVEERFTVDRMVEQTRRIYDNGLICRKHFRSRV